MDSIKNINQNYYKFIKLLLNGSILLISFLVFYWLSYFQFITRVQSESNAQGAVDALENLHVNIAAFIFIPLIVAITRSLFPQKTSSLGDWTLFLSLLTYWYYVLSQLFLGSCIITIWQCQIAENFDVNYNCQLYRWNPFNLPEILVLPSYLIQLVISTWALWVFLTKIIETSPSK